MYNISMKKYDYLIVGCGLYGATIANLLIKNHKKVLIVDKRNTIAGNIYTENKDGIDVHIYGPHIFHTDYEDVWEYVNSFVQFKPFINQVIANYKGKFYHLPFNMNTFHEMWGVTTKEEAIAKIDSQKNNISNPKNLEEQAISLVGTDIFNTLIKGYTEKQRGDKCENLPSFIIKRLPLRFEYNNNYYNDKYQGIPTLGYTELVKRMIEGADVLLNTDYIQAKNELDSLAENIVYTGPIDEFFDYKFGYLDYRSLRFETFKVEQPYYQNNCVINYTEREVPYTRVFEHKYFLDTKSDVTYVTREYPQQYKQGLERYYPILNDRNIDLYNKYLEESKKLKNVYFGGRLGKYKYFDMDDVIKVAFNDFEKL